MGNARALAATIAILAASNLTPAFAGPCADQIDTITKTLAAQSPSTGAPTAGTLSGAGPNAKSVAVPPNPGGQATGAVAQGNQVGLSSQSPGRTLNGAVANVASSSDKRLALAQQKLASARALDAQNNPACREAANQASELAKPE